MFFVVHHIGEHGPLQRRGQVLNKAKHNIQTEYQPHLRRRNEENQRAKNNERNNGPLIGTHPVKFPQQAFR
ncbi:Uncharacterised protein [Enterobacter cloacae]|nr:Uncharacterised protein [Enterobacter cloacae]